jgi:hypothetical protein
LVFPRKNLFSGLKEDPEIPLACRSSQWRSLKIRLKAFLEKSWGELFESKKMEELKN